jgi:hypothetical protein
MANIKLTEYGNEVDEELDLDEVDLDDFDPIDEFDDEQVDRGDMFDHIGFVQLNASNQPLPDARHQPQFRSPRLAAGEKTVAANLVIAVNGLHHADHIDPIDHIDPLDPIDPDINNTQTSVSFIIWFLIYITNNEALFT